MKINTIMMIKEIRMFPEYKQPERQKILMNAPTSYISEEV